MAPRAARVSPFGAVADPTRRAILDLLLERGTSTAGEIAAAFPHISRPAVSKHLRVLRAAGLVTERAVGRERRYRLNPEPLREMYEAWLHRYERFWADRLQELRDMVEKDPLE